MDELKNKGVILVIGIMVAVAIAGVVIILFLNKDYQAALAEKSVALSSQQTEKPDVSAQENQKPAGKAESTIDACVDFDNEKNYYVKGIARIGNNPEFNEDYCFGNRLSEFYCNKEGGISEEFYICQNGCKDGACVQKPACTDSDSGQNYYTKGTTFGINGKNSDYCFDGNPKTLVELYCDEQGNVQSIYYECTSGCIDGACVDTDLG